ncbi:hypothetical protein SCHPADRAFT_837227 [Schizopora paradoxa]|uniref:Anaphase-promoting complex subunit 5 n=1 Tax=Schizopora paradoxa TaxID=27342 RepID=A0A0H2R5G3_9AGAM|nr:hypothetical protein SCHPADRAFT_837227 [Schizopora paradoxa]
MSSLLLDVPGLLVLPPNHKAHVASCIISLRLVRSYLAEASKPQDLECRAWTALAEIGSRIIRAGWTTSESTPWAGRLVDEVENAIGKGLLMAQRLSTLSVYKQSLLLLQARLAHWQQNVKFSRSLVKRLSSSFTFPNPDQVFDVPSTPPWLIYSTYLTSISHCISQVPPDYNLALSTLDDILNAADRLGDLSIKLLTHILKLRICFDAVLWDDVGPSLTYAEGALGLSYDEIDSGTKEKTFVSFEDPFEASMAVHFLIMAVVYFTHVGDATSASKRLMHLHALLDSDVLKLFPTGTIQINLKSGPPLIIKCTHPRVLIQLAYLVSSVSKRDAVGRRPRRKVFAAEGINLLEKEIQKEIPLDPWADLYDPSDVGERMVKMHADLFSELVAVCIMRSELDDAEKHLDALVAHTRSYGIFEAYAARISLHYAHFAHAVGDSDYAEKCYSVAAHLSEAGTFVNISARAGNVSLQIGNGVSLYEVEEELCDVVQSCKGMGGTLEAVGHVLQACISNEILTSKSYLKSALDLASASQDNHLRGLVLALISNLYLRTAETHARAMLDTCGQIAAGLGAPAQKSETKQKTKVPEGPVGNAYLGLWVGEQFLDIYRREGNEKKAKKQELVNDRLADAAKELSKRRFTRTTS